MGISSSSSIPRMSTRIQTSTGTIFRLSYHDLVDHILLLRQVIAHPEMIQQGETLNYFIKDYCDRMAVEEMTTKRQQFNLPWQIDWVWHVHRLHPLAYLNDCKKQLPSGVFVDKKIQKLEINQNSQQNSVKPISLISSKNHSRFVPSLDLTNAILRQRSFLNKFQKHNFYSCDLKQMELRSFENLVQNYICFVKLARKNTTMVPTFDIDLMWHTHMRYPSRYLIASTALCDFLLDHDDSIDAQSLVDAYQTTATRWRATYKTNYGQEIDRKHLREHRYLSSCAMIYTSDDKKYSRYYGGCGGGVGGISEDAAGSVDGGGCGGGCGGD